MTQINSISSAFPKQVGLEHLGAQVPGAYAERDSCGFTKSETWLTLVLSS